jgi:hypothetical protein
MIMMIRKKEKNATEHKQRAKLLETLCSKQLAILNKYFLHCYILTLGARGSVDG